MQTFYLKRNDQLSVIRATLADANGAVDLSGATVRFHLQRRLTGTIKVDQPATVDIADAGQVSYAWAEGDTDTAGIYDAEWEVTFGDGRPLTFPNRPQDGIVVEIAEDFA